MKPEDLLAKEVAKTIADDFRYFRLNPGKKYRIRADCEAYHDLLTQNMSMLHSNMCTDIISLIEHSFPYILIDNDSRSMSYFSIKLKKRITQHLDSLSDADLYNIYVEDCVYCRNLEG